MGFKGIANQATSLIQDVLQVIRRQRQLAELGKDLALAQQRLLDRHGFTPAVLISEGWVMARFN
ncbi:hypothetical protein [Pseudomonas frederiksbergensis]|uniref:hypothetical protein n=1 Tax=Pseudomonas frederiksbergensis TaxID=104087 RepID=UPI00218238D8|nr:hypothetical protein [Pseudomonas frederiksbergensis]